MFGYTAYDSMPDLGEIRVYQRADFQSGSRVLKKVFWTLSYLYLWHTMWFHAKKLLRTLKFWKSLNSLCKSGSQPQKSPKKSPKNGSGFTQIFESTGGSTFTFTKNGKDTLGLNLKFHMTPKCLLGHSNVSVIYSTKSVFFGFSSEINQTNKKAI